MSRFGTVTGSRRRAGPLVVGLLVFATCGGGVARAAETEGQDRLDRAFFGRFGRDFRDVVLSPARWGGRDFLTLTAVTGAGILVFAFDQDIQDWAQGRRSLSSDRAASLFSLLGNGAVLVGLSAAVYAAGEIGDNVGLRRTALLSLESLAAASIMAWTVKFIVGRSRPYTDESSRSFHPFSFKNGYWSFPSGHAVASFSVATAIAEQTENSLIDVLAYSLATLAAISRVHDNKHWASDVFFGSALGHFVARKVCNLHKRRDASGINLGLDCSAGRTALTLSIAF